ncbi:hypothetical protein ACSZN2_19830 [Aeromonas hydrophila]|uniref:hypothetical protein n=1 Tax=Aeromonas hydrophila TaxID=644 RepID=UPI003EC80354
MNNTSRMIGFTELEQLRHTLAAAYMDLRGMEFHHAGVVLPLNGSVLGAAIDNNIIGAFLQEYGSEQGTKNASKMLGEYMLNGTDITPVGLELLDNMNRAFCNLIRGMLDAGQDPMVELERERKGGLQ